MARLVNQGAYGCLYHPGLRCNGSPMDDLRYATKLVVQDEVAENEVAVGNAVKNIVNYSVNFVPVIDTCAVNLGRVRQGALDRCDIVMEQTLKPKPKPKPKLKPKQKPRPQKPKAKQKSRPPKPKQSRRHRKHPQNKHLLGI